MRVLGAVPEADIAIESAREDHGELRVEIDEPFDDRGDAAGLMPARDRIVAGHDAGLALAVIAHAVGLDDRGRPGDGHCGCDILGGLGKPVRRGATAQIGDEALLVDAALRDFQSPWAGAKRHLARDRGERRDRHILELIGHDIACRGKSR